MEYSGAMLYSESSAASSAPAVDRYESLKKVCV